MVHVLGIQLPDRELARYALTHIYGVGHKTAHRICARLLIHDTCRVADLSPGQISSLAAFLSSPSTAPAVPRFPLALPRFQPPSPSTPMREIQTKVAHLIKGRNAAPPPSKVHPLPRGGRDPLPSLKIETDLRREVRENIAHQRMIGSYVGKRHAMGLPVRGQNTQSNASTARKLNRIDRFG
ncbi:hypothetical protein JAAARDRAFT_32008 [Jaapia argillacea MUCL 33604]|uniref:Small ribosomal subunit protein uS13m n=1 Tax=Jaapia argillacea MUCL 33604 TaxID=933084 RepID=A0A067Q4D4_9AGAM|nr:hypothetical protein JAAARDRAFT_32008 [Jaapia argillacea MUCL 33604]